MCIRIVFIQCAAARAFNLCTSCDTPKQLSALTASKLYFFHSRSPANKKAAANTGNGLGSTIDEEAPRF